MNPELMEVQVFKTSIATKENVLEIAPRLNNHPQIKKWNVDHQDIDHVLRIVPKNEMDPEQIIQLVQAAGFVCEELLD